MVCDHVILRHYQPTVLVVIQAQCPQVNLLLNQVLGHLANHPVCPQLYPALNHQGIPVVFPQDRLVASHR
eukprot:scaffold1946_cov188-Ochromonas_danica.AAC.1